MAESIITVTPNTIDRGETSLLEWSVTNVDSIKVFANGVAIGGIGNTEFTGSRTVNPNNTTVYRVEGYREIPLPTITLTVDDSTIDVGDSTRLCWATENAVSVTINGVAQSELNSCTTISPTQTTTYTGVATNQSGNATSSVLVTVVQVTVEIIAFTSEPEYLHQDEDEVRLLWEVVDADYIEIQDESGNVLHTSSLNNSSWLHENLDLSSLDELKYTLVAYDDKGNNVSRDLVIEVVPPLVILPEIIKFESDPTYLYQDDDTIKLSWEVIKAERIEIVGEDGEILHSDINLNSEHILTGLDLTGLESVTYKLIAYNSTGQHVEESLTIEVRPVFTLLGSFFGDPAVVSSTNTETITELRWNILNAEEVRLFSTEGPIIPLVGEQEVTIYNTEISEHIRSLSPEVKQYIIPETDVISETWFRIYGFITVGGKRARGMLETKISFTRLAPILPSDIMEVGGNVTVNGNVTPIEINVNLGRDSSLLPSEILTDGILTPHTVIRDLGVETNILEAVDITAQGQLIANFVPVNLGMEEDVLDTVDISAQGELIANFVPINLGLDSSYFEPSNIIVSGEIIH